MCDQFKWCECFGSTHDRGWEVHWANPQYYRGRHACGENKGTFSLWTYQRSPVNCAGCKVTMSKVDALFHMFDALEKTEAELAKYECECSINNNFICHLHPWRHAVNDALKRARYVR